MPRRCSLGAFFLATAVAAVAFHWGLTFFFPQAGTDEKPLLPVAFPEAYGYSEKSGTPPHYKPFTLDGDGNPAYLGAVFRSTEAADAPRGYAGPVPVLVGLDGEGVITGVALLAHRETPSYVIGVESRSFLDQFTGRRITDPLELDVDIDGVSRATVTAAAVTDGVRLASRAAARRIMGLPAPAETPWQPPWVRIAALASLIVIALLSMAGALRPLRWLSFSFSIAVLGYWTGTWLSTETAAKILLWRLPSFTGHTLWYLLVPFGLLAALLWKNVYCARLCPFGALQEIVALFGRGKLRGSEAEERAARILRPLFLWLAAMSVFVFGLAEAAGYEPFGTAFDFKGGALRWTFLATVLLLAFFRHRFWCRWFCPTGLLLQLLGRMKSQTPFQETAGDRDLAAPSR